MLDQTLGLLDDHLSDLHVTGCRLVESRRHDLTLDRTLHVRDFLGSLIDQQNDQHGFGMILGNGACNRLQQHGLAGTGRRHDQSPLALAHGGDEIHDSRGHVFRHLESEAFFWIERRQVVEEDLVADDFGMLEVDGLDLDQGKVALAFLGLTHLSGNGVARAQIKTTDLAGAHVDVVRTREVVVLRSPQKSETVRQAFQHAFREDQTTLLGLRLQDLEDQLLFAHAGHAFDAELTTDIGQLGNVHLLECADVQRRLTDLVLFFDLRLCHEWHSSGRRLPNASMAGEVPRLVPRWDRPVLDHQRDPPMCDWCG